MSGVKSKVYKLLPKGGKMKYIYPNKIIAIPDDATISVNLHFKNNYELDKDLMTDEFNKKLSEFKSRKFSVMINLNFDVITASDSNYNNDDVKELVETFLEEKDICVSKYDISVMNLS